MAYSKEIKPTSTGGRVRKYLIGGIGILVLLGLFVIYWPAAIAIICGVILWQRKKSQATVTSSMFSSGMLAENTLQEIKSYSSSPTMTPSIPTPEITIEYNFNRSISRSDVTGINELKWASYEDILEVSNYIIEHPLTYWASGKTRIAEASCIEKNLPVSDPVVEQIGALGYWPRYENMTPSQRGNYLHWLASGKKEQLNDIGYAFVYFYGLERRVLIDGNDVNFIIPEVVRLLRCYPESRSFNGYLSRFIAFSAAKAGLRSIPKDIFTLYPEQAPVTGYSEDLLAVTLCWFYQNNLPLPARWAYEVARQDVRTTRSVVIDRVPEQFITLFAQKYHDRFGEGMMLKVADRERLLEYHPASPSLLELRYSSSGWAPVRISNVLSLQSQFTQLVQIWNACVEELRGYSRVVGKGVDVTTRDAWEALPPALRKDVDHPDASRWDEILAKHAHGDGFSIAPLAKLAEIQGIDPRERLTAAQSRALVRTAEDIGLAIVPDARITGRVYGWSDEVVLFRQDRGAAMQRDSGYLAAACMLELGMVIAGADETVDPEELERIEHFLDDQFRLSSGESRHLKAYGLLLSKNPPSVSSLSKPLRAALTSDQRSLIGKYLVGVAAANGIIDRKENAALKRVYKALEIDVSALDTLLAQSRQISSQPVEVLTEQPGTRAGETIPMREQPPEGIPIDYEALTRIMAETAEVSRILGMVLCETEGETGKSDTVVTANSSARTDLITPGIQINLPFSDGQLAALDIRYHAPLAELLTRQAWSKDELDELAKSHQIMPLSMLEAINAWADETLGDILIEDGNEYRVDLSLVEGRTRRLQ